MPSFVLGAMSRVDFDKSVGRVDLLRFFQRVGWSDPRVQPFSPSLFSVIIPKFFPVLILLSCVVFFQPAWAIDIDNQDGLPDFSSQSNATTAETINPLGAPGQILFQADMGFIPASGPSVSGAIGNEGLGTGFLVGLEGGYTIYPNLALTASVSVHAFGNDTNIPLLIGAQYFFANGGGFPVTFGNTPFNIVPYLEFAFGPAFNSSTASDGQGVGALAFAFRVGPGIMVPLGTVKHQGIFFEIDYENQSGPFSGSGISSSSMSLVPVKLGYITLF